MFESVSTGRIDFQRGYIISLIRGTIERYCKFYQFNNLAVSRKSHYVVAEMRLTRNQCAADAQ
jgi:hypothetical protein